MKTGLCIALLVFAMVAGCRSETVELNAGFVEVPDLVQGDRVFFNAQEIGRVAAITRQAQGGYLVGLQVSSESAAELTEYARCYIIEDPAQPRAKALEIRLAREGGAPIGEGAILEGINPELEALAKLRDELDKGLQSLEGRLRQYGRDLEQLPETESYQKLKQTLREWLKEMERAGDQAREKLEKKWLPRIQQELEELRRRLEKEKDAGKSPDQSEPGDGRMIIWHGQGMRHVT